MSQDSLALFTSEYCLARLTCLVYFRVLPCKTHLPCLLHLHQRRFRRIYLRQSQPLVGQDVFTSEYCLARLTCLVYFRVLPCKTHLPCLLQSTALQDSLALFTSEYCLARLTCLVYFRVLPCKTHLPCLLQSTALQDSLALFTSEYCLFLTEEHHVE